MVVRQCCLSGVPGSGVVPACVAVHGCHGGGMAVLCSPTQPMLRCWQPPSGAQQQPHLSTEPGACHACPCLCPLQPCHAPCPCLPLLDPACAPCQVAKMEPGSKYLVLKE